MKHLKRFESFENSGILIIVDVQKSFRRYFSEMYLNELKKYCENFSKVYQIWDNHVDGKIVNKDYLYDNDPEIPIHDDLYHFPNQVDLIEKRYNYDVDADFYKKILDEQTHQKISEMEEKGKLKIGDLFSTIEGTFIVYVGNNHKWHHLSKKLYDLLSSLKGQDVTIVGGSDSECLEDIFICAKTIGVNIKRDWKYIWTPNSCPI